MHLVGKAAVAEGGSPLNRLWRLEDLGQVVQQEYQLWPKSAEAGSIQRLANKNSLGYVA